MVAAGTWCAGSCQGRNKPQDRYQCYLATTCGAYNILSVCEGAAEEAAGASDGRSLRELMFSSATSARQMNRGAGEPALLTNGEQGLKAGRETAFYWQ